MKRSLFWKMFLIITASALVCCVIATAILAVNEEKTKKEQMRSQLELMAQAYSITQIHDETLAQKFSENTDGERVVFIKNDGKVFVDTETDEESTLENHANRPEVIAAKKSGIGFDVRNSNTLHVRQLYAALRAENGDIIRVSVTLNGFVHFAKRFIPIMALALSAAVIAALIFSKNLTQGVVSSLKNVQDSILTASREDYGEEIPPQQYEELNDIIYVFNRLRGDIKENSERLERERRRVNFIIETMEEGLVLVGGGLEIIMANSAAKSFFGCETMIEGKNILYLTRNNRIVNSVEQAVSDKRSEIFYIELDEKILSVHVTPVASSLFEKSGSELTRGGLVVLTNVTAEKNAEKMRQDFFSNAGHELKTPLTSIMGFAELIESGIATPESRDEYIGKILGEARRMSALINDILEISRLESANANDEKSKCNLMEIAEKIRESLLPQSGEKNINVTVAGEDVVVYQNYKQMHELLENIMSNAIKYNKTGGSAVVTVGKKDGFAEITVSDTGIGIPVEAQSRVFERFFRVDKGRSRKEGSTGLGLAIVKHIVNTADGEISLKSKPNFGTTITVRLPL